MGALDSFLIECEWYDFQKKHSKGLFRFYCVNELDEFASCLLSRANTPAYSEEADHYRYLAEMLEAEINHRLSL